MFKLKSKDKIEMGICNISGCDTESTKLWSTETNIIDVCERHYDRLKADAFIS